MELTIRARKSFPAFQFEVDCRIGGERVGIFGPSGCGKSTLVRLLAGLETPEQGEIILDGTTLFSRGRGINLPPQRRRVGVVFQNACLFPHLNVRSNLLYGFKRRPVREEGVDFDRLIAILGLDGKLERGVDRLSGGECQRVALGRAVLARPRLLIMDEPLTGLDEELKYQIIPYLNRVCADFAIPLLFISHDQQEMRLMTDTVLEFAAGRVVGETTPEALARRRLAGGRSGYLNLLRLDDPRPVDDLWSLRWGENRLIMLEPGNQVGETMVELAAKDVTLFKRHPEASSARNLLACRVSGLFPIGNRVGVELACGDRSMIAQVVGDAARELGLEVGSSVVAAIKASAFRRLL